MGYFVCKGMCKRLHGYEKGHVKYMMEGKKWCFQCNYKIKIDSLRCDCCGSLYRVKSRRPRPIVVLAALAS
jgi:hypothetical protein